MSLLQEIQASVIQDGSDLGPILLKLRLLAARLGSQPLADWVKYESEGYSKESVIPDYRIIPVSYTANFIGPFGASISNTQIPSHLIKHYAGDHWNEYEARDSIAAIDELMTKTSKGNGALGIDAANLILLLQGKIYPTYNCSSVTGTLSSASLAGLRHSVRSRVLELTIELEQSIPEAADITLGKANDSHLKNSAIATQISNQIIYGNLNSFSNSGGNAQFNITNIERDTNGLIEHLKNLGISESDAIELAQIVSSEEPESKQEPLGAKANHWLIENLKKAANGTWKVGVSVATDVIKEAVLKYYGFK